MNNNSQKIKGLSEVDIDNKNKFSLQLDENNFSDNYTIQQVSYDTDHGKSIFSDENNKMSLGYDSEEDDTVQELKRKLSEKMKTFYY